MSTDPVFENGSDSDPLLRKIGSESWFEKGSDSCPIFFMKGLNFPDSDLKFVTIAFFQYLFIEVFKVIYIHSTRTVCLGSSDPT